MITTVEKQEDVVTIYQALAALERGFLAEARELATKLRKQKLSAEQRGGPPYIFGAVAAQEAIDLLDEDQRNYFAIAARYLEESRDAGFPPGCENQGWFLLGKSLCLSGRTIEGREMLERALEGDIKEAAEAERLLAKAYGEGPKRDVQKALEHISEYIEMPDLPAAERHDGLMTQANLLWELGDAEGCREALDQIPLETVLAPDAALLRGRLLLEAARKLKAEWKAEPTEPRRVQVMAKYEEAISALRRGQDDPLRTLTVRQSLYLVAVCFLETEDYRSALNNFARARKVYLDTPEGIAAALQEADLLRELEQHDEAIVGYRRALSAVPEGEFVNGWIPADEFRRGSWKPIAIISKRTSLIVPFRSPRS